MAQRPARRSSGQGSKRRDSSVRTMRSAARRVSRVSDLYRADGYLEGRFATEKVYAWFQRRHKTQLANGVDEDGIYRNGEHEWKVPYGVRLCIRQSLLWTQMIKNRAWAVTWVSPKTGQRLKKYFGSPMSAINFIATKAQYVDRHASLISRSVGYDIPAKLRGKIPKPYKWCPYCMTARKFKRVVPQQEFFGNVKVWSEEKKRYIPTDRRLALMRCEVCGCTNRDPHMRRSNQPWEVRRFKRGVRRAKRRTR